MKLQIWNKKSIHNWNEQTSNKLIFQSRVDELSTGLLAGLNQIFLSLLFIVNCLLWIESSLSFLLFLFSWHSWWGKSRIPNEAQNITYVGRNFGSLAATVSLCPPCTNLHGRLQCQKERETEMTYAAKLEMYVTSSILSLTGLLCFKCVSKPCTQMNDPAKEFLLQLNEMAYTGQI